MSTSSNSDINENKKDDINSSLNNYGSLLNRYIEAIKPINSRLNELLETNADIGLITGDLTKAVAYLKNFHTAKKENMNPQQQQQQQQPVTSSSITKRQTTAIETKEEAIEDDEDVAAGDEYLKEMKTYQAKYVYICSLLKGSKLIMLNKWYNKFYKNKQFTGNNKEESEMLDASNKFDINIKLIQTFVNCKKNSP